VTDHADGLNKCHTQRRCAAFACLVLVTGFAGSPEPANSQTRPRPVTNLQAPADSQIENWKQEKSQTQTAPLNVPSLHSSAGAVRPGSDESRSLFRLSKVSIDGASTMTFEQLEVLYQHFLAREVSQADLLAIATAITQKYRDAGYHLSRAIIPAQELKGGHLRIQVIEGVVEDIVLQGDDADPFGLRSAPNGHHGWQRLSGNCFWQMIGPVYAYQTLHLKKLCLPAGAFD
jgi:hemolysin activation/secretion protein